MVEIVVARYKEDINWISHIRNDFKKTIYNKFYNENINLPNFGREAHTYLYHIINNYDNLQDFTIFLQGHPFDHNPNILNLVNCFDESKYIGPVLYKKPFLGDGCGIEGIYSHGGEESPHPLGLPMYYFFDLLFGIKMKIDDKVIFSPGAQFCIDKKTILFRPKSFYKFLISFVSSEINPIEAWIIERLWRYIFDKSIPISTKYENFL